MKKIRMLMTATLVAIAMPVATGIAQANLTTAQAQAEFNKQVKKDAADGLRWVEGGSLSPLISKAKAGGWIAEGDYVHRCSITCALNSQICTWKGWLSPSGYWVETPRKWNCR